MPKMSAKQGRDLLLKSLSPAQWEALYYAVLDPLALKQEVEARAAQQERERQGPPGVVRFSLAPVGKFQP
jgi:hypothetical protein